MNQEREEKTDEILEENNGGIGSAFSSLPEGCISNIISLTTPKDACRASTVSRVFKSASESDTVWERFLPYDYKQIISKPVGPPLSYATKKDLFFNLCHSPMIINDANCFWLSKSSGKKCYMICARELEIAWKDDPRFWRWKSIPESRLAEYSYGLDVVAKAYVRFSEDIKSSLDRDDPQDCYVYLTQASQRRRDRQWSTRQMYNKPGRDPQPRADGWMEILLGEFFNDKGEGDVEMKLLETEILTSKLGLIVEGIELRSKEE
ncbi:OLC1v1019327C1 [Oldenlandia corymbosa var. corymbosa]|uniref:OLC1v1019327C1 n=1 Tax=Oldenlandia corymbosa var. corymbosa TaxID=529605 RepID=A0AAV1EE64_OLDCO|nr:OLC1v1019327C1 [Oldenlandia corymbosa var. corymbosa]